jgi:Predicted membrane protein (DUF2339)
LDLVFVLLGLVIVATPLLTVFVFVRQQRFDRQLRELVESSAQQNDALHRELIQLRRQVESFPNTAAPSTATHESAAFHAPSVVPSKAERPAAPAATIAEPISHPVPAEPAMVQQPAVVDKRTQPTFCAWCGTVHAGGVSQCPKPESMAAKVHPPEVGLPEKQQRDTLPGAQDPAHTEQVRKEAPEVVPTASGIPIEKQPAQESPSAPKHDQTPVSIGLSEAATSTPIIPPQSPRPAVPVPPTGQSTAAAPPRIEKPQTPLPPRVTPLPAGARVVAPPQFAPLRSNAPRPTAQQRMKSVFALEETLGTNWLNKLGIIILVLGVALFGIYELGQLGPAGKVGLSYVVSVALLAGGILLEKRERYRVLGHTLIGGGWALLFFTTYALNHVQAMRVLASETTDLLLMLVAALGMAAHTLRYRSQLVTGLSFLLAYGTVSLSHDNVYSLASGVILALGLVSIVIKMDWFELEVFGILSSYLNHLYWLYKLLGADGAQGRGFPEYHASTALLLFYWLIYRFSYVLRKTESPRQEHVSTAAALLNTLLLMGVMKFQSVHPELAFVALLAIGAVEFACGQLPITKRRREAFIVLSVLGAALMIAAVPFRYSGNNVAILWLIGGEALLVAGVVANEKVFRRLGLLTGVLVGMHLVGIDFAKLMDIRNSSEQLVLTAGAMFSLCAIVFYLNTLLVGRRWEQAFTEMTEAELISAHSYIGAFAAGSAAWALCSHDWTALAFAGIMLTLAALASKLKVKSGHLQVQYGALAVLTLYRVVVVNLHTDLPQYTHVRMRLLTLPLIVAAFYVTAKLAALRDDSNQRVLRGLFAFAGTALVTALGYYEVPELWQALAAIAFAVALVEVGQRIRYPLLVWHAHLVTALAVAAALTADAAGVQRWHNIPLHAFGALPVIVGAYWIARRIRLENAGHVEFGRIAYSWAAAGLMVWVLKEAVPLAWIAVSWIAFAVALAICLRWIRFKHLAWQANVVAVFALIRVYIYNFTLAQPYWRGVSVRMVTVSLVAAGLYFLSRKAIFAESDSSRPIAYLHTFAATGLLALLAWYEAPGGWLAAVWAVFALVLALVDLGFELDDLRWQAHALAAMAVARSVMVNLYLTDTWHGISVRLLSVAIVAVDLYVLSRVIRMPAAWRDREFHHIYSWSASALVAMLLWYELTPMSIAVGWAVFGLVLFEYGLWRKIRQFRFQAYTALAAAFGRIFFANLTAGVPGELLGPRLYTVLPLSLTFFFVYAQLQPTEQTVKDDRRLYFDVLLGYIGTGTVVAFLYFQFPNDWLVTAWAVVVFALLGIALLLKQPLFLYQGLLLTVSACLRGILHNLFGASYFSGRDWTGRYVVLGLAVAVLLACLPFAFRLRARYRSQPLLRGWLGAVARRPEQLMFFAPVILLTLMLALKMRAGMVTVAWGIEGVLIVLLALAVGERSYRLTGLVLLLACVAKVLVRDAWGLAPRDRYITFIILGAALLLVSFLYTKYSETIRQFL